MLNKELLNLTMSIGIKGKSDLMSLPITKKLREVAGFFFKMYRKEERLKKIFDYNRFSEYLLNISVEYYEICGL